MSPFHPDLLNHNEAQLDFILEMYVRDNPKSRIRIERPGSGTGRDAVEAETAWANVLTGKSHDAFMAAHLPPPAVMARLKQGPGVRGPEAGPVTLPSQMQPRVYTPRQGIEHASLPARPEQPKRV